jgi:hypothetical protein
LRLHSAKHHYRIPIFFPYFKNIWLLGVVSKNNTKAFTIFFCLFIILG